MIKVIIVDDHQMVIDGMKSFLQDEHSIDVVGEATSGEKALELLKKQAVDIVILDIRMPNMDGEAVLKKVREDFPRIKVLAVTMSEHDKDIQRMLHNGAYGYLLKDKGKEELVGALHQIQNGHRYIPPSIALKAIPKPQEIIKKVPLTKREREVLKLLMEGLSDKEIGDRLFISAFTAETHSRNIRKKTNTNNRVQLSNYARKHNLLD